MQCHVPQDEETQVMSGLAWATVGELEPKMHQLEQLIEHSMPGKLQKIESRLGPAQQKVAETEREYEEQVCTMMHAVYIASLTSGV